jgi:ligand-binding sensor domain-containing protein/signal transduction histidine kinase
MRMRSLPMRPIIGATHVGSRQTFPEYRSNKFFSWWSSLVVMVGVLATCAQVHALDSSRPLSALAHAAWSVQDGLPSGLIWALAQDRDGYLWVGTDTGLVRFDGVRFVAATDPALASRSIRSLLSTSDGSLWVGTSDGLVVRMSAEGVQHFSESDGTPQSIGTLVEDSHHRLWAGGRRGLAVFTDGKWSRTGAEAGMSDEVIAGLYEDTEQTLWVAGSAHLYRRLKNSPRFELTATRFFVRALCADATGRLWAVGPQQVIAPLDERPGEDRGKPLADVGGWRLIRDRQGNLWVATLGGGVLRLRVSDSGAVPVFESLNHQMGLTSDSVRALFEDREGNLWVGTQDGLNRISDTTIVSISNPAQLSQPVRAVTSATDGAVWIATDNGMYRVAGGSMRHFGREQGLPSVAVGAVHSDRRGGLWAATDHGGLARLDALRNQFEPVKLSPEIRRVWAMTSDDDGALWLCEVDLGVFRWANGTLTSFSNDPGVAHKFGTAAFTDHHGRVWIGFSDGTIAARDGAGFHVYTSSDGLPDGAIGAIYEDAEGTLWVGAAGGLRKLSQGRFVPLDWQSPVQLRNVRAIIEDREHHLWVGVSTGLIRIDQRTHAFTVFDSSDGLQGMPMSVGGAPTSASAGDGTLWFVTSSGAASVDPSRVNRGRLPPPVHIEGAIVDDRNVNTASAARLPPTPSRIEIDYTGLSLAAPNKVRFRYMLEGFDRNWIDGGTRRQAFYTNLPPRRYRFRVVAENDGVSNDTGDFWDFSIEPTFSQTGWFWAAIAAATLAVTIMAWQLRARQVQEKFSFVLAERVRVAREIHDTLLQSLAGVAFQFDTALSELDDSLPDAKKRLSRLRGRIEEAIRAARDSIWELRSVPGPRPELPSELRNVAERVAGSSIPVSVEISGDPVKLPRQVEEAFVRIAAEALTNSLNHASASRVIIKLDYAPDTVSLCIGDDGCGFDTPDGAQATGHWGLITMRERAAQIRASFSIRSVAGQGTEVIVALSLADGKLRD